MKMTSFMLFFFLPSSFSSFSFSCHSPWETHNTLFTFLPIIIFLLHYLNSHMSLLHSFYSLVLPYSFYFSFIALIVQHFSSFHHFFPHSLPSFLPFIAFSHLSPSSSFLSFHCHSSYSSVFPTQLFSIPIIIFFRHFYFISFKHVAIIIPLSFSLHSSSVIAIKSSGKKGLNEVY